MGRDRTLQATIAMMLSALTFAAVGFVLALMVHPDDMNPRMVGEITGSINGVVVSFTAFCAAYSSWIIATFSLRRPVILSLEIATVLVLLAATVPLFSLAYLFSGLNAPLLAEVSSSDALIFSTLTFAGASHPTLTPSDSSMLLYTAETLLGYFIVPLMIALALILVDRRGLRRTE